MIFWTLVGIIIGYFFKPQIDRGLGRLAKRLRKDRDDRKYYDNDRDW